MLDGRVEFLFYQMFVSGAAFTVYKTAPVTLLQLQLPQPLFFLLVPFGFDWIFHSRVELPHAVGTGGRVYPHTVQTPADLITDTFMGLPTVCSDYL